MSDTTSETRLESDSDKQKLPDENVVVASSKTSILSLPPEIIEMILEDESLNFGDITSFGLSCRQLYQTVFFSKKLWKVKVEAWKRERKAKKWLKPLFFAMSMMFNNSLDCHDSDLDSESESLASSYNSDSSDYDTVSCKSIESESELSDCFLE